MVPESCCVGYCLICVLLLFSWAGNGGFDREWMNSPDSEFLCRCL